MRSPARGRHREIAVAGAPAREYRRYAILSEKLTLPAEIDWHEESNRKQRVKRWVLFFAWQVWKRIVRAPIIVTLFNGLQFRAYPDCQSSSAVMYTRIPDSHDILYLRAHVWEGTLIDVGANLGLVTLLVADRVQHALLFEPNPIAAPRARENLALLEFWTTAYRNGLS